jgi:hypothetical protein
MMKFDVKEVAKPSGVFASIGKAVKVISSLNGRAARAMDNPLMAFVVVIAAGAYIPFAMWLANRFQFDFLLYPVLFAVMYFGITSGLKGKGEAR